MNRRTFPVVALSVAAALSLAVPRAASASSPYGVTNSSGGAPSAPGYTSPTRTLGGAAAVPFPSADSMVVGSVGFIDDQQVGYFWSAARGHRVSEMISGKKRINRATLKADVTYNGLVDGAHVDWTLSIDGTDVGNFMVNGGQVGPITHKFSFDRIKDGKDHSYDVEIRVTNEVARDEGAISLRYAGSGPHTISHLTPRP